MILTEDPIEKVLHTGKAVHSHVGERFIKLAAECLGLNIIAVYFHSGTEMFIPPKQKLESLVKKRRVRFVRSEILTLWCRSSETDISNDEIYKEKVYALFKELIADENIVIDYPRTYIPDEMNYYGWTNKRTEEWDTSKIIQTSGVMDERHTIVIEYIDQQVLWNYLQDSLKTMNICPYITNIGAQVFCGYDEKRKNMAYYIILPEYDSDNIESDKLCRSFSAFAAEKLKPRDKWNVINEFSVSPIICKWNDLSEEMKFALAKG